MFILPLTGDTVETLGGVKYTVLSYTTYRDTPSVYVEGTGAKTDSVEFSAIIKINGTPVKLNSGKVFSADSKILRKIHLPQSNDKVVLDGVQPQTVKIKSLKLFERGNISGGMLIIGENVDTQEPATARLFDVSKLDRANGESDFSRAAFRRTYKDYLGAK